MEGHLWPLVLLVFVATTVPPKNALAGPSLEFGLPVTCELGRDCFVQQMPDLDPGPGVMDPLCGNASYDGHNGWDIRLRSFADLERDVPVVAVADGRVLRIRDGIEDVPSVENIERSKRTGTECGNGVVVQHADGIVSQYCHLRRGSVRVRPSASVRRGERIGSIGASGLAEFPHVHLSVRRNGVPVDPFTGSGLNRSSPHCVSLPGTGLFTASARKALNRPSTNILDIGLAAAPPRLDDLQLNGNVKTRTTEGTATIVWVWVINVEAGDRFQFRVVTPNGMTLINKTTDPLSGRKANYLAYVGRRQPIGSGTYMIDVELLRKGKRHVYESRRFSK